MNNTPEQNFQLYVSGGDLAALGRVFDRLSPELFSIARKLVAGSPSEDAEDLVQATFVTAIEKATEFDGKRSLGAWLVGVLAFHAQNARRKQTRRGTTATIAEGVEPASKDGGPAKSAEDSDWVASIRIAVAGTPSQYQSVLEAVLLEDQSPAQAALRLDMAPGTVRQRLRRGLAVLRESLVGAPVRGTLALIATLAFGRRSSAMRAEVLQHAATAGTPNANFALSAASAQARRSLPTFSASTVLATALLSTALLVTWIATNDASMPRRPAEAKTSGKVAEIAHRSPTLDSKVTSTPQRSIVAQPDLPLRRPVEPTALVAKGYVQSAYESKSLEGAIVWLHRPNGTRSKVAETDAKGRFRFEYAREDIAPVNNGPADLGLIQLDSKLDKLPKIEVTLPGYAHFEVPANSMRRLRNLRNQSITSTKAGAQFFIDLSPAHRITGRVLDVNGVPAQAEVFLLDHRNADLLYESAIGRTKEDGTFDIRDVGEFNYRAPRSLQLLFIGEAGTGFIEAAKGLPKDLGADALAPEVTDLKVTLHKLKLRVRVTDEGGTAIPNALVEAKAIASSWDSFGWAPTPTEDRGLWLDTLPASFANVFRATTDDEGYAEFNALPQVDSSLKINGKPLGEWIVRASATGFATTTQSPVGVIDDRALLTPDFRAAFGLHSQTLVLHQPDSLAISGLVLGPDGAPFPGATIRNWDSQHTVQTGKDGHWQWTIRDRGDLPITLHCDARGYAMKTWEVARSDAEQVDHTFRFDAPVGLTIRTIDKSGEPIDGVYVVVSLLEGFGTDKLVAGGGTTQMGGLSKWDELPAGFWSIKLSKSPYPNYGVDIDPIETTVTLGTQHVEKTFTVNVLE